MQMVWAPQELPAGRLACPMVLGGQENAGEKAERPFSRRPVWPGPRLGPRHSRSKCTLEWARCPQTACGTRAPLVAPLGRRQCSAPVVSSSGQ